MNLKNCMKRTLIFLLLIPSLISAQAPRLKNKKYQGLLWEISGNGLKKPSFVFGTMHVSSKLAFHLADSFYLGIKQADVVALETNPESWQEDMTKYDLETERYMKSSGANYAYPPSDYLVQSTLKFYKYDKKVERALYNNPSTINNLLYRSYGNESSDFEEDTYLDMYIYQCGKRWGKKVAGVEQYAESMKLMAEAYKDASKEKNQQQRSYDSDGGFSSGRLQEAYRSGNLDWLDSINKVNSFSAAFDEKFLYRRNEIQANNIDSILRTGQSLFVGVGAAHLPGQRGVIEILRSKGYTLRAVKMVDRDSQHKTQVEKIRVPVVFTAQNSADGVYKVDIPGKFYQFGEQTGMSQEQYADMANGSYYMVTRIMTNAWLWSHSPERVHRIVDSLLYENIPGKILTRSNIVRNGYKGLDITNRTRRGDVQRYNIFVTPFEVIVFKMSGTGDYVSKGEEANRFFNSIQLKEYKSATTGSQWKKFTPPYSGFSVDMPHEPYTGNDGSWIYDAGDAAAGNYFRVIKSDLHNHGFAEEDSFDLQLMEESFSSSEFVDKQLKRKLITWQGYPALDASYKDKNGRFYKVRFIIQGPHYYTLIACGKKENPLMDQFLRSFSIKPFEYPVATLRTDTSLRYTVTSPVFPEASKEKMELPQSNYGYNRSHYGADEEDIAYYAGTFKSKIVSNDTTGEKIFVHSYTLGKYLELEDSTLLDKAIYPVDTDTSWIVRLKKKTIEPNGYQVWESQLSDTSSSRMIWVKNFYRNGVGYGLVTELDTLTKPSSFLRNFYDSFTPADTVAGISPFTKKSGYLFQDFFSGDSTSRQRAISGLSYLKVDSTDLPQLTKAIQSLSWKEKKYLDTKKDMIGKLSRIKTPGATDELVKMYHAAGDTLGIQMTVLASLVEQKTSYAINKFRDIVVAEPPVLSLGDNDYSTGYQNFRMMDADYYGNSRRRSGSSFLFSLYDSLKLTKTILPDLLPFINLDDYKDPMMALVADMADSGLMKPADYEAYYSKFMLEAKQELRKQAIIEKQQSIQKAEKRRDKDEEEESDYSSNEKDPGNDELQLYARLLVPFWESRQAAVPGLFKQMLSSSDKQLKYTTMLLMIKNKKVIPDTLLNYFAGLDEYRYELYRSLRKMKELNRFPDKYNNHIDLGRSKLLDMFSSYSRPDSFVYVNRLSARIKGKEGFVYFYKYKKKKDDLVWRLAAVGLVPKSPKLFEFDDNKETADRKETDYYKPGWGRKSEYQVSNMGTRLKEDQPLDTQLAKELKRLLFSSRKSGREFFENERDEDSDQGEIEIMDEEVPEPPPPAVGN